MAALAYSLAEEGLRQAGGSWAQHVRSHNALQFASRWLTTVVNDQIEGPSLTELDSTVVALGDLKRPANAISHEAISDAASGNSRDPRIGLVGPPRGYGLAHQTCDMAMHLGVDRWLVRGPREAAPANLPLRIDAVERDLGATELEAWLDGLDAVIFVERPAFPGLAQAARQLGVCVICVPNWEWLSPAWDWLRDVDVMLCPTRHTARILGDWKRQFGFTWHVREVAWPIDTERFAFRQRHECRRFVYVHGSGGAIAAGSDGNRAPFRRKGLDVLLDAARLVPQIPIIVYAHPRDVPRLPANVEWRRPPMDSRLLYSDGDVCVQPSHWEGLGLPLLECQAAGMPLITTDAPPMNEHQPMAVVAAALEAAYLSPDLCIPAARIQPHDLAATLKSVFGRDIRSGSRRARQFVERRHSWQAAGGQIRDLIKDVVFGRCCAVAPTSTAVATAPSS